MDNPNESERKKDEDPSKNGLDVKDEQFWQNTTKVLASTIISDDLKNKDGNEIDGKPHPENVFYVHCKCLKCLNYRQLIQGIFVENTAYNTLWNKLQDIIKSYYSFMPADQDTAMDRKYNELITDSCGLKWFSDGSIDFKKNLHVSMGSNNFSLSNEMTFIIVFNMLYTRDRHQLFELLCLQLTSIVLAYREGVKEITKCEESNYDAEELLNFILNGFDRITEIAETLTPLVIEMRDHLQKFSLTWLLMNQCMYYRFLYLDIESRMADCILRLKDTVDNETYKQYVYRFIKFDEQMTTVSQSWNVALVELDIFRKFTEEQIGRIERIGLIRSIFMTLNDLNIPEPANLESNKELDDQVLTMDWIATSEKNGVWMNVMNSIKNYCRSHKNPCNCWACLMIDTNGLPNSALDVFVNMPTAASIMKDYKNGHGEYHLAWSIFKHLKDRKPYKKQFVHPEIFCVFNDPPCDRIECLVATNIIVGSYPLDFSKCLIKTYRKLTDDEREKFLKIPMQSIIKKYSLLKTDSAQPAAEPLTDSNLMLLLNMYWDTGETENALRNGLAAALAEKYKIDVKFPHKHIIYSYFYALFRTDPVAGDIVLDLQWLEQINLANLFKSFGSISNTLENDSTDSSDSVNAIEMTLNELKITGEVNIGSNASETLDLVQFSMKEVADKLSSINLTDDDASAKSVIENEIKKPLVEALKLAASNKILEAELKSLQKEHNMLKDMVKGLEQIHGEKKEVQLNVAVAAKTTEPLVLSPITPEVEQLKVNPQINKVKQQEPPSKCGHSHPTAPTSSSASSSGDHDHEHPSGGGSSGGADCVCYYCTLFGKNQDVPLNTRTTETRDRLRKRLHHLQKDKDLPPSSTSSSTTTKPPKSFKNIGMLLKNGNPTVTKTQTAPKCTDSHTAQHKCTAGGGMKMKVELEVQQRKKKTVLKAPTECCKIQRETEHNLKSIENLMEYIEGAPAERREYQVEAQKRADDVAAKKQVKKIKQQQLKIQRQYDQRIQDLVNMNGKLQIACSEQRQMLNQLGQVRNVKAKSRDPKKIKLVEDKVKEAINKKQLLEEEAKELVKTIQVLNPDFNAHEECDELKNVLELLPPPKPPTPVIKTPIVQRFSVPAPVPAQQTQQQHQNHSKSHQQQQYVQQQYVQQQEQQQQPNASKRTEEDPAKRMVTIRRINLPHSEPQVTVTAKGNTPDMDQLLYTFVNGQLVPASSLSASALQDANGSIQLFMSSNNSAPSKVETVKRNGKKQQPPPPSPVAEEIKEIEVKVKKDKKKTKEVKESQKVIKNELKVKDKVKIKDVIEKPKKYKKPAFIDPEFSNNAFGMLDDENHSQSEESESEDEMEEIPAVVEKAVVLKEMKKTKEEMKNVKKHASGVSPVMSKSALKREQKKKDKINRDNSTASSQASVAEVKLTKKQSKAESKKLKLEQLPPTAPTTSTLEQNYMQALKVSPGNSASIMDQLSRGIRVEGLRLPPGITLTKVIPNAVDSQIAAKKESIAKITQPMSTVPAHRTIDENLVITQPNDPNGVIMVESVPYANNPHLNKVKNNKKKKKANKMEAAAESKQEQHQQRPPQNLAPGAERMVTLRNPMFGQSGPEQQATMTPSMRNSQPTQPFTLPEPHTASIFKNENGMYTIRNPAFQNAFFSPPTPTAAAVSINPTSYNRMNTNSYAPFGETGNHNIRESSPSVVPTTLAFNPAPTPPPSSTSSAQPKCNSAIGSEMKNVLQRRKEQEFHAGMENAFKYGAVGTPPRSHSEQGYSHFGEKNNVNSGNYMMNFNNGDCEQNENAFMSQSGPNFQHQQSYPLIPNYDDLRLQPGQHLNSEVTIHNVSESKFFQKGIAPPMVNSIGITRINGNGMQNGIFDDLELRGKAAQQQQPQQRSEINGNESVFTPNQKMNLNELESDDRDIETFKRFDYYFEPPKNKLKVNINVKDIVVNTTSLPKKISVMAGEEFEKKPNSTNSNSPSSLTNASVDFTSDCASSLDEFYENGHPQQKSPYFVPQQNYDSSKLFGNGI
ncbi:unnamed protein product [Diamesa serratosioi]